MLNYYTGRDESARFYDTFRDCFTDFLADLDADLIITKIQATTNLHMEKAISIKPVGLMTSNLAPRESWTRPRIFSKRSSTTSNVCRLD